MSSPPPTTDENIVPKYINVNLPLKTYKDITLPNDFQLNQPLYKPHGKYASTVGKAIKNEGRVLWFGGQSSLFTPLPCCLLNERGLGGVECSVYVKKGQLDGKEITYLSKM